MAQIDLSGGARFDASRFDPEGRGPILEATEARFSYLTTSNHVVTLRGADLLYGAGAGAGPTGGRLSRVDVAAPADGGTVRIASDGAVSDLPAAFFSEADAFWAALLGGADAFDLSGGSPVADLFGRTLLAGDGYGLDAGRLSGADDAFELGGAGGQVYGDLVTTGSTAAGQADYAGGDDTVTGGPGAEGLTVFGDVGVVSWVEITRGGDDVIALSSDATVYGDLYRQLYGGEVHGGDDRISLAGEAGGRVFGDAYEIDDFGGAMRFRGGDDTIDASAAGGTVGVAGDVHSAILSRGDGGAGAQVAMGDDEIRGSRGNDTLNGDADHVSTTVAVALGRDAIDGGRGDDLIHGDVAALGANTNALLFSGGDDTLDGGRGDDTVDGAFGDDVLRGGKGADLLRGGVGADDLLGGTGKDTLKGDLGADDLRGGGGNDRLDGGGGDDRLSGGGGKDRLKGGAGADTLEGGGGDDRLGGGAGEDLFVFAPRAGDDKLKGFQTGADRIDISAFGVSDGGGDQSWRAAADAVGEARGNAVIEWDGGGRLVLRDVALEDLSDADFLF